MCWRWSQSHSTLRAIVLIIGKYLESFQTWIESTNLRIITQGKKNEKMVKNSLYYQQKSAKKREVEVKGTMPKYWTLKHTTCKIKEEFTILICWRRCVLQWGWFVYIFPWRPLFQGADNKSSRILPGNEKSVCLGRARCFFIIIEKGHLHIKIKQVFLI